MICEMKAKLNDGDAALAVTYDCAELSCITIQRGDSVICFTLAEFAAMVGSVKSWVDAGDLINE